MVASDARAIPPDGDSSPGNAERFSRVRDYLLRRERGVEPGPTSVEAWDWFNRTYDPQIRGLCARYGRGTRDHEDAVQDVWLKLIRRLRDFEYDSRIRSFHVWLGEFVRRIMANRTRRKAFTLDPGEAECVLDRLPDPRPGAPEQYDRDCLRQLVRENLDGLESSLSHETYRALILRWMEERSIAEIAIVLRITPSQASDRIRWGMFQFAKMVANHPDLDAWRPHRAPPPRCQGPRP